MRVIFSLATCFFIIHNATLSQSYSTFESEGRLGLINSEGEVTIPPNYEAIGWSKGEELVINDVVGVKKNNLWALYNLKKKELTSARFAALYPFSEGLFLAARKGQFSQIPFLGIINEKGKTIVGFGYYSIQKTNKGFKVSKYQEGTLLYGLLNAKDEELIPIKFAKLSETKQNWFTFLAGKTMVFSKSGSKIFEVFADSLEAINSYFLHYKSGKVGLLNSNGETIIEPSFKKIRYNTGRFEGLPFPTWYAVNQNKKDLFSLAFDLIKPVSNELKIIGQNGYYGVINNSGQFIIKPYYTEVIYEPSGFFILKSEGKWEAQHDYGGTVLSGFDSLYLTGRYFIGSKSKKGKKAWGLYTLEGKKLSHWNYAEIRSASEQLFPVKKNAYWGFINNKGNEVIQPKYQSVGEFKSGNALVKYHGFYGIINRKGEFTDEPTADTLYRLNTYLFARKRGILTELIDEQGEVLYNTLGRFESHPCGILEVDEEGRFGFLNEYGRLLIEPEISEYIYYNKERMLYLKQEEKDSRLYSCEVYSYVSESLKYDELYPFSEGYAAIKLDGAYGFIDHDRNLRIANRYDSVTSFTEGLAGIKINNGWGFVDQKEELVVQPLYDSIGAYEGGKALVKKDKLYGIINQLGEEVLPIRFNKIDVLNDFGFLVEEGNNVGFYSDDLTRRIKPKYQDIEQLGNWLKVKRKGKYGILSKEGLTEYSFKYAQIIKDSFSNIIYLKEVQDWETLSIN